MNVLARVVRVHSAGGARSPPTTCAPRLAAMGPRHMIASPARVLTLFVRSHPARPEPKVE